MIDINLLLFGMNFFGVSRGLVIISSISVIFKHEFKHVLRQRRKSYGYIYLGILVLGIFFNLVHSGFYLRFYRMMIPLETSQT